MPLAESVVDLAYLLLQIPGDRCLASTVSEPALFPANAADVQALDIFRLNAENAVALEKSAELAIVATAIAKSL